MRVITYTVMTALGLIILTGLGYATVQLFNGLLYEIFINTERTLAISIVVLVLYSAIVYKRKRSRA
jgi:hypothetical protein